MLFPAPPSTTLLVEAVESVIARVERKRREAALREAQQATISSAYATIAPAGEGGSGGDDALAIPTLEEVLATYRVRQDAAVERYTAETAERLTAVGRAVAMWAGDGAAHVAVHVAAHNTDVVAHRVGAWAALFAWAKESDAARARVLAKMPKRTGGGAAGAGESSRSGSVAAAAAAAAGLALPPLQACVAPEPLVHSHLVLSHAHPQVASTVRAVRAAMAQIAARAQGVAFFTSLTSSLDSTPLALLSSIVCRAQVFPSTTHLREIVHTFKARCFFRRVFVIEPRTGIVVACDRAFCRYAAPIPTTAAAADSGAGGAAPSAAAVAAAAALAAEDGVETSYSAAQAFVADYLAAADACRLAWALHDATVDDISGDAAMTRRQHDRSDQGDILSVAEGGFAPLRLQLELSGGEGVFCFGLAPPVGLWLACIGDNVEAQRLQSLVEFNLHIVQGTIAKLFEESLKRARAEGYLV
jgi:hypothetical protein